MRETIDTRTVVRWLAVALGASLFGLLGLPVVFGGLPDPTQAILWLGLAVTVAICLLPVAILLAKPLARVLLLLPIHGLPLPIARRATSDVARLAVAATYLVVIQAILRRPLVAVFGASADPFTIEASVAIAVMLVVGLVLIWLHSAARPLVEGIARVILDASLATWSAEEDSRPATATRPVAAPGAPTLAAPQRPMQSTSDDETVHAPSGLSRAQE